MQAKELLKDIERYIERLQAQSNNQLGYHLNQEIKAFILTLKEKAPRNKITFEDYFEDTHTMTWHNALELCRDKVESLSIHTENTEQAMREHENGEETEFDPYKMESEAEDMSVETEALLENVLKAVQARI